MFTNLLLADEINRTPPKTQAALLEAMEERQVTRRRQPHPLPEPFVVVATQNPVEYEGTYPLPEAQLDRFLFKLVLPLPQRDDEERGAAPPRGGLRPARPRGAGIRPVATAPTSTPAWQRSRGWRSPTRWRPTSSTSRGPPGSRRRWPGRQPARRHRAAATQPGVGLARRPRLRDPRRGQGAGPAALAHRLGCGPRPSSRASASAPCSTRVLGSVPVPADGDHGRVPLLVLLGLVPVVLWPTPRTCGWWLLVVLGTSPSTAAARPGPGAPASSRGGPTQVRLGRADVHAACGSPTRPAATYPARSGTPGPPRPARRRPDPLAARTR